MLRLGIVTLFGERLGGSDNVLWTFLGHLDRDRIEPLVVFLGAGPFEREVAALGIETVVVPSGRLRNPLRSAQTIVRLRRVLSDREPDLIVNWLSSAQLYGAPAAALAGMASRSIWWQHDLNRRALSRGRALDQLATLLPAAAIGACSSAVADAQRQLRPKRRVFSVAPGIDAPNLDGAPPQIPIPSGRTIVGSVGRLFAWKGHHQFLEALAILIAEGHDLHGVIVGGGGHRADDDYEAKLSGAVARLGLADRVLLTGQVADATPYIDAFDLLVSASGDEPFGLVLLEAMALRVPVVAVAGAGPQEIVEDGVCGFLVADNSPPTLAGGIRRLLAEPALRIGMGEAGHERWKQRFTGARMTAEMQAALEELAA